MCIIRVGIVEIAKEELIYLECAEEVFPDLAEDILSVG